MRFRRFTQTAVFDKYGARSPAERRFALLDVAQDHFLLAAQEEGVFARLGGRFVGGTALRKHRFGADWRISHDIDLGVPTRDEKEEALSRLDGAECGPFRFRVIREGKLRIGVEGKLMPAGSAFKLDVSTDERRYRPRITPPVTRRLLPMPASDLYGWAPSDVKIPTLAVEENVAEKLCRQHRRPVARDVHDLASLAGLLTEKAGLIARLAARTVWERPRTGFVSQNPHHGRLMVPSAYGSLAAKALGPLLDGPKGDSHVIHFVPDIDRATLLAWFHGWHKSMLRSLRPFHEAVLADERLVVLSFVPARGKQRHDRPSPLDGVTSADQEAMIAEIESEIRQAVHDGEFTDIPAGTVPDDEPAGTEPVKPLRPPAAAEARRTAGSSGSVCGKIMPRAKKPCVLPRGHAGAHRSVRPKRS